MTAPAPNTLAATCKQIAAGQVRAWISVAAGSLVTMGWLSTSKTTAFEDAAFGAMGVVGILAWSAAEKIWVWVQAELAKAPAGSVEGQVLAAVEAAAPVAEQIVEPMAASALAAEAAKLDIPLSPPPAATFVPPIMGGG